MGSNNNIVGLELGQYYSARPQNEGVVLAYSTDQETITWSGYGILIEAL